MNRDYKRVRLAVDRRLSTFCKMVEESIMLDGKRPDGWTEERFSRSCYLHELKSNMLRCRERRKEERKR